MVAKELGIEPFIIRDIELERKGFGGIYGVGKAAPNPPALAVLSYNPVVNIQSHFSPYERKILNVSSLFHKGRY